MLKSELRHQLTAYFSDQELARWFDPLTVEHRADILAVDFPHAFFGQWFNHFRPRFEQALGRLRPGLNCVYGSGQPGGLSIGQTGNQISGQAGNQISGAKPGADLPETEPPFLRAAPAAPAPSPAFPPRFADALGLNLKPPARHLFETFAANRKNDFPLAAAKNACKADHRPEYAPMLFYGVSGAGKTHLLGAMANALDTRGVPFFYGDAELFAALAREACGAARPTGAEEPAAAAISVSPVVALFSKVKALFLDDAHRLPDLASQEALIGLLDAFASSGRLLALTTSSSPGSCRELDNRLTSRLCAGLALEIKKADLDVRRQYAQRKTGELGLELNPEQIFSLAQRYPDIRAIDGVINRLVAYRDLMRGGAAAPGDVGQILLGGGDLARLTPATIISAAARHFSVAEADITGKLRDREATLARHICMYLCREMLGLSFAHIGRFFDGRDHSSIHYSVKKITQILQGNKDMNSHVARLRQLCLSPPG